MDDKANINCGIVFGALAITSLLTTPLQAQPAPIPDHVQVIVGARVPFGSHQWPTLITPGPGAAALD